MGQIMLGNAVEANLDLPNKNIKKGDQGVVVGINCIDSEDYLDIKLDNGDYAYCSSDNCWNKIQITSKQIERDFVNVWTGDENNTSKALIPRELIEKAINSEGPNELIKHKIEEIKRLVGSDLLVTGTESLFETIGGMKTLNFLRNKMTQETEYNNHIATLQLQLIDSTQLINELLETVKQQAETINSPTIARLHFGEDTVKQMEVVFPGGILATPDEAFSSITEEAIEEIAYFCYFREELAISGAMRWPWSQEAPLKRKRNIKYFIG